MDGIIGQARIVGMRRVEQRVVRFASVDRDFMIPKTGAIQAGALNFPVNPEGMAEI